MENLKDTRNFDVLSDEDVLGTLSTPLSYENTHIQELQTTLETLDIPAKNTLWEHQENIFSLVFSYIKFVLQFFLTSSVIFLILLVSTNYSAYLSLVNSYINKEELEKSNDGIISSVEASNIILKEKEKLTAHRTTNDLVEKKVSPHSIKQLMTQSNKQDKPIGVEITPFENRIVIPKIGKNIPLLDIGKKTIEGQNELQQIFMKELENGVIRYPGSAKPGQEGTTFVFGHSSNFPWIDGEYNDVFALLDKVVYDDIVIVYYDQKKYTFKIREKKVILPGDVSVLKRNNKKSEISIMTCWPIGTTLKRLVVVWELIEEPLQEDTKQVAMK